MKPMRTVTAALAALLTFLAIPVTAHAGEENASVYTRYAVALYGINHDRMESGETAGLSFGPAAGRDYKDDFRAHISESDYACGQICLHWMTWPEIAEQSAKDPTAFQACLEYGCTHSVDVQLNSKLANEEYRCEATGDGYNAMLNSLKRDCTVWGKDYSCPGGWPASRARAVLNGADEFSDKKNVGESYMLSKDESIFACFPEDLKSIIARKEVSSFVESDGEYAVTYDSLWLFSDREVYGSKTHHEEGEQYERNVLMSQNAAKYGGYTMYREDGSEAWAWFRSTAALAEVLNCHIFGGGHWVNGSHFNNFAITPGFCIA